MSRPLLRSAAPFALAIAVAAGSALPADAGHRNHYRSHGGDAFAAGVAGAILGAIITAPRPVYVAPPPVYYVEPAPVYVEPYPVYVEPYPVYSAPRPVYGAPEPYWRGEDRYQERRPYRAGAVEPDLDRMPLSSVPERRDPVRSAPAQRAISRDGFPTPPREVSSKPRVVTYEETVGRTASATGGAAEAWSPQWRSWCESKYRSFDAATGTFMGYDGQRRFCVVR